MTQPVASPPTTTQHVAHSHHRPHHQLIHSGQTPPSNISPLPYCCVARCTLPPLRQLLYARNLDLASQAAEAITHMGAYQADWLDQGAVPALAELLSECATHAQAVGLSQRHSGVTSGATSDAAAPGRQQRVRVSVVASGHCLVCNAMGHESCGFCPLSQVVKALLRVMTTDPATQQDFMAAGGLPLLFGLMRQEAGQQHSRLLASCAALTALAVVNNSTAQEVVRGCGGLEVLGACLSALGPPRPGGDDIYQLRAGCVAALTVSLKGNHANKITAREQGVLAPVVGLLRTLVEAAGVTGGRGGGLAEVEDGEQLLGAVLDLVAVAAAESPGNQVSGVGEGEWATYLALGSRACCFAAVALLDVHL